MGGGTHDELKTMAMRPLVHPLEIMQACLHFYHGHTGKVVVSTFGPHDLCYLVSMIGLTRLRGIQFHNLGSTM